MSLTNAAVSRRRFDRDVAWSAFAMLVPIGVGLLGLPIIFHNTGETVFSLFLLSYGAISFAPSLDLGVARTAQRRIAYAHRVHTEDQWVLVRHSLRRAFGVAVALSLVVSVCALLLLPTVGGGSPIGLVVVTGLGVGVGVYANTQRGILEGLGAFSRSALNRAGLGVLLIGVPVLVSFEYPDAALLSLASLVARLPFVWEQQRAIRHVMRGREVDGGGAREDVVDGFMRESGWFALLALLAVAMSGFDRYILVGLAGLTGQALAIFLATQDMALRAVAVPAALIPALTVRLAAATEVEAIGRLSRRLFLALIPPAVAGCIVVSWLSDPVAKLLYPALPVAETSATLRILLFGVAANAIAQFPAARLIAAGRARDAACMHLLEFAVYLAAAPFLVVRYGAWGAAALWSVRTCVDAALLIGWSGFGRGERQAVLEGVCLCAGLSLLALCGWLA
jgi:O-antigen/teichoic acid export membrane protein